MWLPDWKAVLIALGFTGWAAFWFLLAFGYFDGEKK